MESHKETPHVKVRGRVRVRDRVRVSMVYRHGVAQGAAPRQGAG